MKHPLSLLSALLLAPLATIPAAEAPAQRASPISSQTAHRAVKLPDSEFQYMVDVDFDRPKKGKTVSTTAYPWIPHHCQKVRAVILAQQNGFLKDFCENRELRQICTEADVAIFWCDRPFDSSFKNEEKDGNILQDLLNRLAAVSGYDEIATAYWLPIGGSSRAPFPPHLANWKPERTVAQVVRGHADYGLPNNRLVPMFEEKEGFAKPGEAGEENWLAGGKPDQLINKVYKARSDTPRPLSYVMDYGSSHSTPSPQIQDLMRMFIRKALKARLPVDGGPLRPINIDSGWGVDSFPDNSRRYRAFPMNNPGTCRKNSPWFFDEEMARAVEKVQNVDWNRKPQVPVFVDEKGNVAAFKEKKSESIPYETGPDGVTLQFHTSFLKTIPQGVKNVGGLPLGHAKVGDILVLPTTGCVEATASGALRLVINRFYKGVKSLDTVVLAYHPGDDEYRPSWLPGYLDLSARTEGRSQKIHFDRLPNITTETQTINLQATADSGMKVAYFVKVGPASLEGSTLRINAIPPRSKFPIKVTVVAYQWGRAVEPKVQTAVPVEQTFMISLAPGGTRPQTK